MKSVRVGCVKYLNARPLICGWPGIVEFDHPSALSQRLAGGQLDVALVSSFEFLRHPIYRIVDDVSISSDGPVYSVVVAYSGDILEIKEIVLDPASQTSVKLLQCLLGELGIKPRLLSGVLGSTGCQPVAFNSLPGRGTARLLIGDQAIQFRQKHAGEFHFWDLGEQWKNLAGLPFVYALWLIRPEVSDARFIAQRLRGLRDKNLADLRGVVMDAADEKPAITQDFLDRYYHEYLRFRFGTREKQGLKTFADLCVKHEVLPKRTGEFNVV